MRNKMFHHAGKAPRANKRSIFVFASAFAVITAVMLFSGSCDGQPPVFSREFAAMDTLISIKAYGNDCGSAVNAAADRVKELEKLFSVTDPESEIYAVNESGSAAVSPETSDIVSRALEMCEKTDGALDITIYPVLKEWGFTSSEKRIPSESEISSALEKTGYKNVKVSDGMINIPDGFMLDLGSCAKGRAGDEIAEILTAGGVSSAIADLGGNVQTVGHAPDGSDWKIGIADPFSPNDIFAVLRVSGKAVVTSGGYRRYFVGDDGKRYIHIMDPSTGRPAESGLASVTVVGDSGFDCDALSTALFVMGKERAVGYWRENGGFDMILVEDGGVCFITPGISGAVTLLSGASPEVIG